MNLRAFIFSLILQLAAVTLSSFQEPSNLFLLQVLSQ